MSNGRMARLIYSMIGSLDGYVADTSGNFDWAVPDEQVLAFINEQERDVGTYLYGRRIYELMEAWENDPTAADSPQSGEFAEIWKAADKVVFSTRLEDVKTTRTILQRTFDPAFVENLKRTATADINIAGPLLASHAFHAGLIDCVHLLLVPRIIGGGKSFFPSDVRLNLRLEGSRRFENGMLALQYDVDGS